MVAAAFDLQLRPLRRVLITARLMQEQASAIFVGEIKRSGRTMTNPFCESIRIDFSVWCSLL
jgi:hypothetical protein